MPSQDWIEANRAQWRYRGQERPRFAIAPRPGQESVWDYPRPPRLAPDSREVVLRLGSVEIARSSQTIRVLETASPPTFYIPPDDVTMKAMERAVDGSLASGKDRPPIGPSRCQVRGLSAWAGVIPSLSQALRRYAIILPFTPHRLNVLSMAYAFSPSRAGFMAAG